MTARGTLPPTKSGIDYERVWIEGRLLTLSPLRVASGFEREVAPSLGDEKPRTLPILCRDAADAPYLPASTLRGLLRASLDPRTSEHLRLFGTERLAEDPKRRAYEPAHGLAGRLRVYDATWSAHQPHQDEQLQQRVSLDPITGTAAENLLFTEVTLPPGCSFDCRLELDRVDEDDLRALILALRALDAGSGIGGGRARGQGRLQWQGDDESVQVIRRDPFQAWLLDQDLGKGPDHEDYAEAHTVDDADSAPRHEHRHLDARGSLRLALRLYAQTPVLVSPDRSGENDQAAGAADSGACARRADDADRIKNRLSFPRDGARTWIPASGMKGMLRAQARRILLTCLEQGFPDADDAPRQRVAEAMLGELMGDTGCMSRLRLRSAEATFADEHIHAQMMNAIDRFSGAVAERRKSGAVENEAPDTAGTLFCVEAVRPAEPYTLDTEVTAAALAVPWMLGLLLLLLRDGMEGDLRIGWGRARGFGAIRVGVQLDDQTVLRNWVEVIPALRQLGVAADGPSACVEALHTQLRERMAEALEASR